MSNVVPFVRETVRVTSNRSESYPVVTTVIDPHATPRPGDTVAFCWFREDGTPHEVILSRYWGPTGRDEKGRFVKPGSPEEEHALDHFTFLTGDDQPYRILGKVVISGWSHDVTVEKDRQA